MSGLSSHPVKEQANAHTPRSTALKMKQKTFFTSEKLIVLHYLKNCASHTKTLGTASLRKEAFNSEPVEIINSCEFGATAAIRMLIEELGLSKAMYSRKRDIPESCG